MNKGCFADKIRKPEEGTLKESFGSSQGKWKALLTEFTSSRRMKGEWKFYGTNFGRALRFAKSGKSVAALYPDKDRFTVQVILNKNQTDKALSCISEL